MRLVRLLPVAALVTAPLLAHPASAGPCVDTAALTSHARVVVCENQPGCLLTEDSSSDFHEQNTICVTR